MQKAPMLVDSHCHLTYDKPEWEGIASLICRAESRGVGAFLNIGCARGDFQSVRDCSDQYDPVFFTVGIHPHEAQSTLEEVSQEALMAELKEYLSHPKAIGIGETGLDYYYEHSPKEEQRSLFEAHINISLELDIPLIVHTRDAEEETIDLLKKVGKGKVRGVIHCFSGSRWLMEESLDLGFYISASGIVTFKKSEDLRQVLRDVPLDRLLVETDAPYLAPVPYRGKTNEPSFVVETAKALASLKDIGAEELASATTQNFFSLFTKMPQDFPKA